MTAQVLRETPFNAILKIPSAGAFRRDHMEDSVLSLIENAIETANSPDAPISAQGQTSDASLLDTLLSLLDENKAEEVITINLSGKTAMADHMVICSGRSSRQVASLAEKLADEVKQRFGILAKTEGKDSGDWVLIDTGDVIVHIFRPEVREFYQLEKIWMEPSPGAEPPRA